MEVLTDKKLNDITGGGKNFWYIFSGIATFLVGVVAGFVNPKKCNG